MKSSTLRKLTACVVFCALVIVMIVQVNDILVPEATNRYYIMDTYLE